jgi:hypothetical protein
LASGIVSMEIPINFQKERESSHRNHTLDSVLILPVQRIPRYCLLLEQLLKYTWEDHCDFEVTRYC